MSISRPLENLNIFDVLSNIIPGTVLIGIIGGIFEIGVLEEIGIIGAVIGVLFGGYVIGHLVQAVGSIFWEEQDISDAIEILRGDIESPQGFNLHTSTVTRNIESLASRRFNLPRNESDSKELNRLILSELELSAASRSLRFQTLYYFFRNMLVVSLFGMIFSGLSLWYMIIGLKVVRHWSIPLIVLLLGGLSAPVFYYRMQDFNRLFIEYAFSEFHALETVTGASYESIGKYN